MRYITLICLISFVEGLACSAEQGPSPSFFNPPFARHNYHNNILDDQLAQLANIRAKITDCESREQSQYSQRKISDFIEEEKELEELTGKLFRKGFGVFLSDTVLYALQNSVHNATQYVFDDLVRTTCGESFNVKGIPLFTSTDTACAFNGVAWKWIAEGRSEGLSSIGLYLVLTSQINRLISAGCHTIVPCLPAAIRESKVLQEVSKFTIYGGSTIVANMIINSILNTLQTHFVADYSTVLDGCIIC